MPETESAGAAFCPLPEGWAVDRAEEGARLVKAILEVPGNVVAIHGRRGGGKTDLIRKWIIPRCPKETDVYYGRCSPELPAQVEGREGAVGLDAAIERGGILFLDSFDRFLMLPAGPRREGLERIFSRLRGRLVLVVSDHNLGELFAVRPYAPQMLEHLLEIGSVSLSDGLNRLAAAPDGSHCTYSPEVIAAIEQELDRFSARDRAYGPDLLRVIDSQARRFVRPDSGGAFELEDLRRLGGLRGLLNEHLNQQLQAMNEQLGKAAALVAEMIFEEVVDGEGSRDPDLASIARRLEVEEPFCEEVLAALKGSTGILRESWCGGLELAPLQLEEVVHEDIQERRVETRHIEEILARGQRSWKELGVLLPADLFVRVHEARTAIGTTSEQAAFLLHSALRSAEGDDLAPSRYWLGRISGREPKINTLLEALFSPAAEVRARAARLLAAFDEPEVRSHLYRAALEDDDPAVRRAAIGGLERMQVAGFWDLLAQEAKQSSSPYHANAIEALRIFKDARSAALLRELVGQRGAHPEVRTKAINTLAATENPESARALVEIALYDEDDLDRDNAIEALASTQSETVAGEALAAIRSAGTGIRAHPGQDRLKHILAGCVVVLLNIFVHGAVLLSMRRRRAGAWLIGLEAAAALAVSVTGWLWLLLPTAVLGFVLPARILLLRRARLHFALRSFQGILGLGCFLATAAISFAVHGLAHLLAGRVRTGCVLVGFEILSVICYLLYALDESFYQITRLGPLYLGFALVLFLGSWLWDVAVIGYSHVLLPGRVLARRRRQAVQERLLGNPHAALAVLTAAESAAPEDAREARRLLEWFGDSVPPEQWVELLRQRGSDIPGFALHVLKRARREETIRAVQGMWGDAGAETRARILYVLASDPSERSLEYLGKLWPELNWWGRIRYAWGWSYFRFKLIPKPLLAAGLILAPMTAVMLREAFMIFGDWSRLPIKFITSPEAAQSEPARVVKTARFVFDTFPDKVDDGLTAAVGRVIEQRRDWRARIAAAEFLTLLVNQRDQPKLSGFARDTLSSRIPALRDLLDRSVRPNRPLETAIMPNVRKILDAFKAAGDEPAVRELRLFVLQPLPAGIGPDRVGPTATAKGKEAEARRRVLESIQLEALRTLGRIATPRAEKALAELSEAATISSSLRQEARHQRQQVWFNPVEDIRLAFNRGQYAYVLSAGPKLLTTLTRFSEQPARTALLGLLGRASNRLSIDTPDPQRMEMLDNRAVEYLEQALRIEPLAAEETNALANSYERLAERRLAARQLQPALQYANRAIKVSPGYAEAHATRGQIMVELKQPVEALRSFAQATRIDPHYYWAWSMQSWVELQQKRYQRALEFATRSIEANHDYSWSYVLLSESYHGLGKDRDAVAHLEKIRKQYPKVIWPAQSQMYIYHEHLSADDPSAYQRNYDLYRELSTREVPKRDEFDTGFAEANLTTGRYQEAIRICEEVLGRKTDPALLLPLHTLQYAASVLNGDRRDAAARLGRLEETVRELPADYAPSWSYSGTLNYLRRSSLAPEIRKAVVELVAAVAADPRKASADVFAGNRRLLEGP
jgi:tetratricopeptide (TPR) repeat protein